jgi:hypothetical protein
MRRMEVRIESTEASGARVGERQRWAPAVCRNTSISGKRDEPQVLAQPCAVR